MRILNNIKSKIRNFFVGIIYGISFSMSSLNEDLFKSLSISDDNEKNKKVTRKRSNSQLLEKFYAGQRDEKYVKDYYEILKKADEFIIKSDAKKYGVTADKLGMSYGKKDKWGRRYEHYGFFDEKSKNFGKTLYEVIEEEKKERKTNDDDYELLYIYDNLKHISFSGVLNLLNNDLNIDGEVRSSIVKEENKRLKIIRDDGVKVLNKIEDLSDYIHVKRIDDTMTQLEFFINRKFKVENYDVDSNVFKEILNMDEIWMTNNYGEIDAYKFVEYKKRMFYNDEYEVIKIIANKMNVINF